MCGLFGFSTYQEKVTHDLTKLTNSLALQSSVRGTDATGVAFCSDGHIQVHKEAAPAHKLTFTHPVGTRALIGHTRHSTQGSERRNRNNHPFSGRVSDAHFALAHNGVLINDDILRQQHRLPKSKIETDSYVAVQLIEKRKELNFTSLRFMAEELEGSYSFSILSDQNEVYLVKGDSPITLLRFPKEKIFVYASTDEILYRALIDSPLFDAVKEKRYEKIPLACGTVLKISPDGGLEQESFSFRQHISKGWWDYGGWDHGTGNRGADDPDPERDAYIEDLKLYAYYCGISPSVVDDLLREGFTFDEVEDYIYAGS